MRLLSQSMTAYKAEDFFKDKRGVFKRILDDGKTEIKSVLLISSNKGAIRGNHWHRKDCHFCYMVSGSMLYSELIGDSWEDMKIKKGEVVVSIPGSIHRMKFLEKSEMLVLATESRYQKNYEKDTVRPEVLIKHGKA